MMSQDLGRLLGDVSSHFERPHDIVVSDQYTREQKIQLLQHWEHDLQLLMVASEESMTGATPGQTAEQMKAVCDALSALGGLERPSGPGKVG
ncbi:MULTISPECIES: hypothetical protein [Nitrospirillum]|uniref:Uncharacterized protein n=1 Tax=Nitrospirillum amazonense TaxID=28077 RepID=A0A560IHV1_9PROT|nr:hypothetical protein [Nitrospirillum amazonense]TWB13992.1 hypothetical protein FBZ89_11843 [Nitrospirillum amazonense]TWB58622.1 hypothetical protein FBZ92_109113 [Nitrospirillum amazonense]